MPVNKITYHSDENLDLVRKEAVKYTIDPHFKNIF